MFNLWLDKTFRTFDKPSSPTSEVEFEVYELPHYTTAASAFLTIEQPWDSLAFSQHQIIELCRSHSELFQQALCLCVSCDQIFVVVLHNHRRDRAPQCFETIHCDFNDNHEWGDKIHYKIIVKKTSYS